MKISSYWQATARRATILAGPSAIDYGIIAVGTYLDNNCEASGSAYVSDVNCPADLNGDLMVNKLDFLLFLGAFASGDSLAGWNEDGRIDTLDFLAYLNDFEAGC